ncbi:MAG TPA: hypothetical protein VF848_10810 [Steroidobacteraceae bacterium]
MSGDLEGDLRRALRPVEPSAEFTDRLLARVAAAGRATTRPRRTWLRPAAVAAGIVLAFGLSWGTYQHQLQERAFRAHAELLKALAITSRSLDQAYQVVHSSEVDRADGG